jgi:hypothetical protein
MLVSTSPGRPSVELPLADVVRHLVNADDDRKHESIILARFDLDTVGVAYPEPPT